MKPTLKTTSPQELMDEHLDVLRGYAEQAIARGGILTEYEERDKDQRMAEYVAIGRSCELSGAQLIGQIFGDTLKPERPQCGCPTCRSRATRAGQPRLDDDLSQSGV
jgi:hypothetical protein